MNPLKHKLANEWMRQDDASPEEALDTWNTMEAEFKANRAMTQEPRTMAQEPRIPFAKAGQVDSANNVKKGQELGKGINQVSNGPNSIRYTAIHGGTESMKKKGPTTNYKTLKEAVDQRASLIKEFGEVKYSGEGKLKYTWENFTKDPKFEEFFKTQLTKDPSIIKVIKEYDLDKNNLEEIFNTLRKEVTNTEQLKRGLITGEKIVSANVFSRLEDKFKYTYKPQLGTIGTREIAKLMDLPELEVSKFMSQMNEAYPSPLERKTKDGINRASALERANIFKNKLDELGIEYNQTVANPKNIKYKKQAVKPAGKWRFTINEDQTKKLENTPRLFKKALQPGTVVGTEKIKDIGTKLSKASDEYKKFGYSKDRTAIQELGTAINRSFDAMGYDDLKKYVKKNPKLLNMVELGFNAKLGEFDTVKIDKLSESQLRQSVFMEADHIRGRSTIKYDAATKKILDGLGIEYPKNLYLIPKMINSSVKQKVENWIATHPNETKKIKMLDQKFKDYGMSYWNRDTGSYGGVKPKNIATDISHLGLDVEELLQNNQSVDKPERLLAKLKQIKIIQSLGYGKDEAGFIATEMLQDFGKMGLKGTKLLRWLQLEYDVLFEGLIYDYHRRYKGQEPELARESLWLPKMIAKAAPELWKKAGFEPFKAGVWEGPDTVLEKRLYEIRGTEKENLGKVIGENKLVKNYIDNQKRMEEISSEWDNIDTQKKGSSRAQPSPEQVESFENQQAALAEEYQKLDQLNKPDSLSGYHSAYQTAKEKQDTKYGVKATEAHKKRVESHGGQQRFEKEQANKRRRAVEDKYPTLTKAKVDKKLEDVGLYIDTDLRSYKGQTVQRPEGLKYIGKPALKPDSKRGMSYDDVRDYWKDLDKQSYYADNFKMEKAEGGIMNLKKKW